MTRFVLEHLQAAVEQQIASEGLRPFAKRFGVPLGQVRGAQEGRNLSSDTISQLTEKLGLEFYIGPPRKTPSTSEATSSPPTWDKFTDRSLPRRGIASCGVNGWGKNQPLSDPLPAPEALDDPDAFYVAAAGQSMIPEGIRAGAHCLVSPGRLARPGDRIWIRDIKGATAIKRLRKIEGDRLHLRGWQPVRDGKQENFEEQRFLNGIAAFYPIIAVYEGLPGNEGIRLVPDPRPPVVEGIEDMIAVRLHDQQFAAGFGALEEKSVMSSLAFPAPWLRRLGLTSASAALVWVKGDSMEPTLKGGSMAMLDIREQEIKKHKIYAFRLGEELFVKRFERVGETLIARSDNPDYDSILIAGADQEQLQVFGEVVWSGHRVNG